LKLKKTDYKTKTKFQLVISLTNFLEEDYVEREKTLLNEAYSSLQQYNSPPLALIRSKTKINLSKNQKRKKEIEEFKQLQQMKQLNFQFQNPKQNKRTL